MSLQHPDSASLILWNVARCFGGENCFSIFLCIEIRSFEIQRPNPFAAIWHFKRARSKLVWDSFKARLEFNLVWSSFEARLKPSTKRIHRIQAYIWRSPMVSQHNLKHSSQWISLVIPDTVASNRRRQLVAKRLPNGSTTKQSNVREKHTSTL